MRRAYVSRLAAAAPSSAWGRPHAIVVGDSIRPSDGGASEKETPMKLYVGTFDQVSVYDLNADGDAPPAGTLRGPGLDGNLYVVEDSGSTVISVFELGGIAPQRQITGLQTGLESVWGMDFDGFNNLYVANGTDVLAFASTATGNARPILKLTGVRTDLTNDGCLAVLPDGTIYVGDSDNENAGTVLYQSRELRITPR
jgi:hypothetical protein